MRTLEEYELEFVAGAHASDLSCWCGFNDTAPSTSLPVANENNELTEKIIGFATSLPPNAEVCGGKTGTLTVQTDVQTCGTVSGTLDAVVVSGTTEGTNCTTGTLTFSYNCDASDTGNNQGKDDKKEKDKKD